MTDINFQLRAQSSLASVIKTDADAMNTLATAANRTYKELVSGMNASTRAAAEMRKELASTATASKTTGDQMSGLWKQVAGGTLVAQGIRAVGGELVSLVTDAVAFGTQWQTTMQQIQGNTLLTADEMTALGQSVTSVMTMGTAGFQSLATAAQYASDYGFRSASDNAAILDEAQKKVTGSGGDAAQIASTLALTMHEYGASASEAAQYTDVMTIAAARGRMTFAQLAEAAGPAIGIAANLKVPIDQVTAAISALTQHGYDTATATTQVTAILTHLVHPAGAAATAFDDLAASTGHTELASKNLITTISEQGLTGVIGDLKDAYAKMGYTQDEATAATFNLLAAQRGGLGMATLLGTANADLNSTLAAQAQVYAGNSTPTQDSYTASTKTLATQEAILGNNIDLVKKAFSDGLTPAMTQSATELNANTRALEGYTKAAGFLGSIAGVAVSWFGEGLQTIGDFGTAVGKTGVILTKFANDRAVAMGEMTQAEADAANKAAVEAVLGTKTAADAAIVNLHAVRDENYRTGQGIKEDTRGAWSETKDLVAAHLDALKSTMQAKWSTILSDAQTAGHAVGLGFTDELAAGLAAGMTPVQAREAELLKSGDLRTAFSVMGKANADAFVTSLAQGMAKMSYLMAATFGGLPLVGKEIADKFKAQGDSILARLHDASLGGGDPFAKAAANFNKDQKTAAADLKADQKEATAAATAALDKQIAGEREKLRLIEEQYAAQDRGTAVDRARKKLADDTSLSRDVYASAGQSAAANLTGDRQALQDALTAQSREGTKAGINTTIAALEARKSGGLGPVSSASLGALPTATLGGASVGGVGVGGSVGGGSAAGTMVIQTPSVLIQPAGGGSGGPLQLEITALCPACLQTAMEKVIRRKGSQLIGTHVFGAMG